MDEEIERLVVSVRADTSAFARDVAEMRNALDGPLAAGAERAARAIEAGLLRAVKTGKFGFEDLRRIALSVLAEIAEAAIRAGIGAIGRGAGGGAGGDRRDDPGIGGLIRGLSGIVGSLAGRAIGGPVAPGVAYLVGERGPEMFVPTASGRVETGIQPTADASRQPMPAMQMPASAASTRSMPMPSTAPAIREVRVAITVNAARGEAPAALAKSSRQIARAVRTALGSVD